MARTFKADGEWIPPTALISSAQSFTGAWANLGGELDTFKKKNFFLWIDYTRGTSTGIKVRILAKDAFSGALEYSFPIKTTAATAVNLEPNVYTFTDGQDYTQMLEVELNKGIPVLQVQVMATVAGNGTVDVAKWSASR